MKLTSTNLNLLNVTFVTSLIISNVVSPKLIDLGFSIGGIPFIIPGAAFCYAITFLMTDVIGEMWGKREANKAVLYGFAGQILASLLILGTQFLPASDSEMQGAYIKLLGLNYVFVIGSLIAYFTSQLWDVWVFHKIRDAVMKKTGTNKHRWIWNNISTMSSQVIDTILFIGISFGIGFGWLFKPEMHPTLIGMFIAQYVVKFILAALDTPIFYLLTNRVTRK